MSHGTCKKHGASMRAKTRSEFPLEISRITSQQSRPILLFAMQQFPSFEESTAAIVAAFFFICPAPCPPCNRCAKSLENCITRQSVQERDNISHARPWHTTKFLAEIYKGRQPGINLARTGTRGKPCFLAFGFPLG